MCCDFLPPKIGRHSQCIQNALPIYHKNNDICHVKAEQLKGLQALNIYYYYSCWLLNTPFCAFSTKLHNNNYYN